MWSHVLPGLVGVFCLGSLPEKHGFCRILQDFTGICRIGMHKPNCLAQCHPSLWEALANTLTRRLDGYPPVAHIGLNTRRRRPVQPQRERPRLWLPPGRGQGQPKDARASDSAVPRLARLARRGRLDGRCGRIFVSRSHFQAAALHLFFDRDSRSPKWDRREIKSREALYSTSYT